MEGVPGLQTQDTESQRDEGDSLEKDEDQDGDKDFLQLGLTSCKKVYGGCVLKYFAENSPWTSLPSLKLSFMSISSLSKLRAPRVTLVPAMGSVKVASWLLMYSSTFSSNPFSLLADTSFER